MKTSKQKHIINFYVSPAIPPNPYKPCRLSQVGSDTGLGVGLNVSLNIAVQAPV